MPRVECKWPVSLFLYNGMEGFWTKQYKNVPTWIFS